MYIYILFNSCNVIDKKIKKKIKKCKPIINNKTCITNFENIFGGWFTYILFVFVF